VLAIQFAIISVVIIGIVAILATAISQTILRQKMRKECSAIQSIIDEARLIPEKINFDGNGDAYIIPNDGELSDWRDQKGIAKYLNMWYTADGDEYTEDDVQDGWRKVVFKECGSEKEIRVTQNENVVARTRCTETGTMTLKFGWRPVWIARCK